MTTMREPLNPETLSRPVGYSHAWQVQGGKTVYLAGQVAFNQEGHLVGKGDLVAQFRQVCENIRHALAAAGGEMTDVVKLTIYVLSKAEYKARVREIGTVYRQYFGRHYPAMTLVEVKGLYDDDQGCAIEVDGVAVVG
jgi:enamine deaminase RidA (YjgF/YER057c/UK114 family)